MNEYKWRLAIRSFEDLRLEVQDELNKLKDKHEALKENVLRTIEEIEAFLGEDPYLVYIDTIEETIRTRIKELREMVK